MSKQPTNKTSAMLEKQNHDVRVRAKIIESELERMKLQKHKPENRTAISKILADRITAVEGRNCSYTTILRNESYKSLIDEFMTSCGYENTREKKELQSDLLGAQLEIRELRKEISQLNRVLSKSQEDIASLEHLSGGKAPRISKAKTTEAEQRAFITIRTLLDKLDLQPDKSLRCVIDDLDGTVLLDSITLPEYFAWLKENNL